VIASAGAIDDREPGNYSTRSQRLRASETRPGPSLHSRRRAPRRSQKWVASVMVLDGPRVVLGRSNYAPPRSRQP